MEIGFVFEDIAEESCNSTIQAEYLCSERYGKVLKLLNDNSVILFLRKFKTLILFLSLCKFGQLLYAGWQKRDRSKVKYFVIIGKKDTPNYP